VYATLLEGRIVGSSERGGNENPVEGSEAAVSGTRSRGRAGCRILPAVSLGHVVGERQSGLPCMLGELGLASGLWVPVQLHVQRRGTRP
jgi:hypothetical protein